MTDAYSEAFERVHAALSSLGLLGVLVAAHKLDEETGTDDRLIDAVTELSLDQRTEALLAAVFLLAPHIQERP